MKTRNIFPIILLLSSIFFTSCDVNQGGLRKFHGNWNIDKIEYYTISSGNYVMNTSVSDAGYFLLYDQMFATQENDCFYYIKSGITSELGTLLGYTQVPSKEYFKCLWYVTVKNQIDFVGVSSGASNVSVAINRKGSNKMEMTYKSGSGKEIYYLSRIDV